MARQVFPLPPGSYSYTDTWGAARSRASTGGTGKHQGTDIFAPRGTPVYAVVAGRITKIGPSAIGGNRIWVNGRYYFAHLDHFAAGLKVGDQVKAGQVIGYVGNTGDAKGTSPHLHFGYSPDGSQGGSWANPYPLLQEWEKGGSAPAQQETSQPERAVPAAAAPGVPPDSAPGEPLPIDTQPTRVTPRTVGPPLAGLPGSVDVSTRPPQDPVETWQLIASQPLASPDSLRLAELANLSSGS